jgi:hypothetical protein
MVSSELRDYDRQFAAIRQDAGALLRDLSARQIEWRGGAGRWSIADCLNHLVVTGTQSLTHMRSAMADARTRGLLGAGPFRHPLAGRLLILLMDAPPRFRFRAPRAYRPTEGRPVADILAAFWTLQDDLGHALREADGIDLARVKVANPVSNWFKMTLGQEFAITAAHERRHLWQAWRVREKLTS